MKINPKYLIVLVIFSLLLSCTNSEVSLDEGAGVNPVPSLTISVPTSRPPTATAAEFEMRPTSTKIPSATPVALEQSLGFGYGPKDFPPGMNPLTGLILEDPRLLERRPMAIKITNFPRSVRPQWGLTKADHVYEYFLEDGLTRFVGIFYGQDASQVGPIRSARPFDQRIVQMYHAIFTFAYADDRVMELLEDSPQKDYLVIKHPDNCPPLCRIGPETDYNTLYTDTQSLSQYVSDRGTDNERQDLSGLRFEEISTVAFGGRQVDRVGIRFSRTSHHIWEYDPGTKRFLRSQDKENSDRGAETYEPLFDSLTGEQIAADNVIILLVPTTYFFKSSDTEIYDIYLKGEGTAYALREGRIFKINWKRIKKELVSLTFLNGIPYPLQPGNVWFEVLGETSTFELNGLTWQFYFDLP